MTGTRDPHEGSHPHDLTQHGADDVRDDWDVNATDPRPTGAGPGETPNAPAEGPGGRDGNLEEAARFHEEQDADPED
jgi:hypothetical protein